MTDLRIIEKAIRSDIAKAPADKKITKFVFSYDANQNLSTLVAYDGATSLFTLTFTYDVNQNLTEIVRS